MGSKSGSLGDTSFLDFPKFLLFLYVGKVTMIASSLPGSFGGSVDDEGLDGLAEGRVVCQADALGHSQDNCEILPSLL